LAQYGRPEERELAALALELKNRSESNRFQQDVEQQARVAGGKLLVRVRPKDVPLPPELRRKILGGGICVEKGERVVHWMPGDRIAIVVMDGCAASLIGGENVTRPGAHCEINPSILALTGKGWKIRWSNIPFMSDFDPTPGKPKPGLAEQEAMLRQERQAIDSGDFSIREVRRRQLFIGDKPVGEPFE
jgi:hypothetical protein